MTDQPDLTLDDVRPREWSVAWEYNRDAEPTLRHDRWHADNRVWPDEDAARRHGLALVALERATGEVRNVTLHVRHAALAAGDWDEVLGWIPATERPDDDDHVLL